METMIRIRTLADPISGPVRGILDDITLSDGEKIGQLLVIFDTIWEVADAYEKGQPTVARSSTRGS